MKHGLTARQPPNRKIPRVPQGSGPPGFRVTSGARSSSTQPRKSS
jgi:hypothetical protein